MKVVNVDKQRQAACPAMKVNWKNKVDAAYSNIDWDNLLQVFLGFFVLVSEKGFLVALLPMDW